MSAAALVAVLTCWAGSAPVFARVPWFARPDLGARVAPFLPGTDATRRPRSLRGDATGAIDAVVAAWRRAARRGDDLAVRLERCHRGIDAQQHRRRDVRAAGAAALAAATAAIALEWPAGPTLVVLVAAPLACLIARDLALDRRCAVHQAQLRAELVHVADHLSMLLGVGRSLSAAVHHLAQGDGAAAADLARVAQRFAQGLSLPAALGEWREVSGVPEVARLVGLLELERHGADLARLVEAEAGALRRAAHRHLVAELRRRAQLVWIPVTVAALVPGTLLLAVPFAGVLRSIAG